ncbi:thioredoxin-like protein [Suillus subalutaceus]|uniref:thioredoxin-like protein n=1 Tax=Suillus subalutaceus TaxID=48586 RepID=UPI001B8618E6|nr:thioredoxin-like protein [Suillus subalutaceus]KAG1842503.1 thioredoxin-like protein [Suillus subalutaceus]
MSTLENLVDIPNTPQFQELLSKDLKRISLIYFWTSWAEPCVQMNQVVEGLAKAYPKLLALRVEAEEQADITDSFDINSVPTCLVIQGHALLARIEGGDATQLKETITKHLGNKSAAPQSTTSQPPAPPLSSETEEQLEARMRNIMNQSAVVLFMKGEPDTPRCGFSRTAVALLREKKVAFTHFDILSDESVRQGLKKVNDWPTFPQFMVKGEFVGGLDVVKEMKESGEFEEVFST